MHSIGLYLRDIREGLEFPLQKVYQNTNIEIASLRSIEDGEETPTKEQVLRLVKFYEVDEQGVLVHWLSEKWLAEAEGKKIEQQSFGDAAALVQYGQMISAFPEIPNLWQINLESRRYIGNKAKLAMWIRETLLYNTNGFRELDTFLDVFAGTGSIAKNMFGDFRKIIVNDILHANHVIYKAFFLKTDWDKAKVFGILHDYNSLNPDDLPENYFSENFGGKFFDAKNAKVIGHIREDLEKRKNELSEKEFSILLATLIYNIDKIANTVGHFDAYIKKPIKYKPLRLKAIQPAEYQGIEIHREDANDLVRKVKVDIAYIDPPYNSRQYNRFYHIYENLVEWKKPELFGVALKPQAENNSVYCTVKAKDAFRDLIQNLDAKYIAVSYNNTYNAKSTSSENKILLKEIKAILKEKGETKVFECDHSFFNTGKTEFDNHKELLFITKVNEK